MIAPRTDRLTPWILLTLGAILRIALWHTQTIPSVDGTAYLRIANGLAGGPTVPTVHQYGYPALIALATPLTQDPILAARVIAMISGLALIPLTWCLARTVVKDPWVAALPTLAVTVMPIVLRYSLTTMTETPYLALVTGGLLLALRGRGWLGGLVGGLAYAVRPEALLIMGVAVLAKRKTPAVALRLAVGMAVVVGAYVTTVGVTTGHWSLSQKTVDLGAGTWADNEKLVGEDHLPPNLLGRLQRYGFDVAVTYPGRAVQVANNVWQHGGWVSPLLALGAFLAPGAVFLGGVLYLILLPATFIGERARYIVPALPFVWLLTAAALARIQKPRIRHALLLLAAAGLAFTAIQDRALYTENEDGWFPELVDAGVWLHPYAGPERVVYDRKPYTAFYADAQPATVPRGQYHEILNELVERKGDFLVVHDGVAKAFRPELLPLIADQGTMLNEPRLVPVYYASHPVRGYHTAIYRIVRPGGPAAISGEEQVRQHIAAEAPHAPFHLAHAMLAVGKGDWEATIGECELGLRETPDDLQLILIRLRAMMEARYPGAEVQQAISALELRVGNDPTAQAVLEQARAYVAVND